MPLRFSRREFDRAVQDALKEIPPSFAPYLAGLAVDVEPSPPPDVLADLEIDDPTELLGLYQGTPLTERSVEAPPLAADRVVIYQRNLEQMCETREELVDEIRATVLHEVGHHFGLDEDELENLGYA